ncbi:phosphoribosylaminoimidazole-succinocarboxamide synthase [Dyadobacter sp. BE34]|uniref:Phosphoribosylaminoimidazole-succinocarboxamide synthase n=1 Tax=Dyadobacter fermentans TaxID=94254 RepID=A0ABU1R6P6_9BACT|nr:MULTISPECIES: phosphoribosylaminoimidazolesuccinocarboxamide synthase [Dyadobacter]MDR6808877.1 phosphoribosylaminoimidazole-succinocarboxamide synthase [Dyadobacter fermentans]MDR7046620.1 phosphoribosylaminoimidazole-succinocarboxamide synthase [Dyadobacter sp. BE242]MDR7200934.1 phosphoribosylaminoimidazole-succinocarboxamide synthase [Dyadobacter sp. BE34]MDR7218894.1 phosphoribosylaminoimidazole-succinocarboxamide synthase [Dyadobacter sp. BE31]MDR7264896.1 phosphoribosylaminoimidazole
MNSIPATNFQFPGQTAFYKGKVRDVYSFEKRLVMIATDRISAFDVILPRAIPYKGQVLNQIAAHFLNATSDIVPNWLEEVPDPNVSIGIKCQAYPVEMVVRGYLAGHAWREYKAGKREVCGVALPEGLKENDKLPQPIITPTTKAHEGHDEDISREQILAQGLVSEDEYEHLERYTLALFAKGTEMAADQGLILVDTKYEFGQLDGTIYLIDEIHTPDSSRYFYKDTYEENQRAGVSQKQLSKEFVREWLIENGFQGKDGQTVPEMTDEKVTSISERYIELFEKVTGMKFQKNNLDHPLERIEKAILRAIA